MSAAAKCRSRYGSGRSFTCDLPAGHVVTDDRGHETFAYGRTVWAWSAHESAAAERMISRRAGGGFNEDESREMLAELIETHGPDTLPAALAYQSFATSTQAEVFTANEIAPRA